MRGRGHTYPPPPHAEFRHGAVWEVILERPRRFRSIQETLSEAAASTPRHLVLVTQPAESWPRATHYWWRSRIVLGDLLLRSEEEIMHDLKALVRQYPPVLRNWRSNLETARYHKRLWHLVWVREQGRIGG